MTNLVEKLQPLKIFGTDVPCRKVRVRGGMRDHEHVYPHSPGAGVELLGRELYKIEVVPVFDGRLIPPKYKDIWPNGLRKLREKFEAGERGPVQIPSVGVVTCYCKTWEQELDCTKSLSGEEVVWHFCEDSEALRLSTEVISFGSSLAVAAAGLDAQIQKLSTPKTPLWDQVFRAIDAVLAYRDQYELYSSLIESKLLSILSLIQQIDDAADELKNPANWAIVEALHSVWKQTRVFYEDQKQLGFTVAYYTTRQTMSCSQLAVVLFDDTSKASELLQLNGFADPFEIPSGTKVKYYKIVSQAA